MKLLNGLLRNGALGMFVGVQFTLVLTWLVSETLSERLVENIFTSATIVVALLSAALALAGIFLQIDKTEEVARLDRYRQLQSARAFLPSVLSSFCQIAQNGIEQSNELGLRKLPETEREVSVSPLIPNEQIINVMRDILRYCDDANIAERIAQILREHQISLARWDGCFDANLVVVESDVRHRTVAWAYIYALIESLFEYARGEEETLLVDLEVGRIHTALNISLPHGLRSDGFAHEVDLFYRHHLRHSRIVL